MSRKAPNLILHIVRLGNRLGHLGTQQLELYAKRYGATVVGNEFIPLDVSDFSSSLSRIEQSKADWIMLLITGEAQSSFFKQRTARGIKTPMLALTSLSGIPYEVKAKDCGYDSYEVKLDHDRLVRKVGNLLLARDALK